MECHRDNCLTSWDICCRLCVRVLFLYMVWPFSLYLESLTIGNYLFVGTLYISWIGSYCLLYIANNGFPQIVVFHIGFFYQYNQILFFMTSEICSFTKKANPFIILHYFYMECKKVLRLHFLIQMNSQPFGIRHSSPIGSKPIFHKY